MKIYRWNEYKNSINENLEVLNENLDKAKKFLRDKYIFTKAAEDLGLIKGELKDKLKFKEIKSITPKDFNEEELNDIKVKANLIKLSPDIIKEIEKDKDFNQIRGLKVEVPNNKGTNVEYQLDKNHIGWIYPFTYFYYYENADIKTLQDLYKKLIINKDIINNLEVNDDGVLIKKEFNMNFIDLSVNNNLELLSDGIDRLEDYRWVKKVEAELTPLLKTKLKEAPQIVKDRFKEISVEFSKLGEVLDSDGIGTGAIDNDLNKKLFKEFFGGMRLDTHEYYTNTEGERVENPSYNKFRFMSKIARYKTIEDFTKAANNYIKSVRGNDYTSFFKKFERVSKKYGVNGVTMLFSENNIVIFEVKSFAANKDMNGGITNHCIAETLYQWNNYCGDDTFNKQYYIYDFNVDSTRSEFIYGVTIESDGDIRAAHDKQDADVKYNLKKILKKMEGNYDVDIDLFSVLKPMDKEERERKIKQKEANRRLISEVMNINLLRKLVKEDGADVNKDNCRVLSNVIARDKADNSPEVTNELAELVKEILDFGGEPNSNQQGVINQVKSFKILELLVSYGAEVNTGVYNNFAENYESIELLLNSGMDPDVSGGTPIRVLIIGGKDKGTRDRTIKPETNEELRIFKLLLKMGAKIRPNTVITMSKYGRTKFIDYVIDKKLVDIKVLKDCIVVIKASEVLVKNDNIKIGQYLIDKLLNKKIGEMFLSPEGDKFFFDGEVYSCYDDISKYGDFVIIDKDGNEIEIEIEEEF